MCRHLAYVGPDVTLGSLVLEPPHSLLHQSYAPEHQTSGVVNADGFGVGWYTRARAEPALYRRATPIWSDASFASIAGAISSGAIMASVRSATPGFPTDEVSTPPFADEHWLFAHNGAVTGFNDGVNLALRAMLTERRAAQIRSGVDSAVLFAMTLDRLDAGDEPAEALARVVGAVKGASGGTLNLLLTDGVRIAATSYGNSLFVHRGAGTIVASEPLDAAPDWQRVPDLSVVSVLGPDLSIDPL